MHSVHLLLIGLTLALASACGPMDPRDFAPPPDSDAPPAGDGSRPPGPPPRDAGHVMTDTGPIDAGGEETPSPRPDAGATPPADAGTPETLDAGTPDSTDAGAPLPSCPTGFHGERCDRTDADVVADTLDLDLDGLPSYAIVFPVHYDAAARATDNTPANNPVTDLGATLGRVLFHDRRLSVNGTVACASCHRQDTAFSDPEVRSEGFEGGRTGAHSMRLGNVRYYGGTAMFWDKRAPTLEAQVTQPIRNEVEMGFDDAHGGLAAVADRLAAIPAYPVLFRRVFGDEAITEQRLQRALAQFVRSIVSTDSRFDRAYAAVYDRNAPDRGLGRNFATFSAQENRGKQLFVNPPPAGGLGCAGCHVPPTFALAANSLSNGLDAGETRTFKSPSLKGVAKDGAFMHDGRFTTLEQVVRHYSTGVQPGPALDPRLRLPGSTTPARPNLSDADVASLVAFLRTLDDDTLAGDTRFTSPFADEGAGRF